MSPIKQIADGIHKGDWQTVCAGYEKLTGETLPVPVISETDRDVLQQIYDIVAIAVEEPGYVPCSTVKTPKRKVGRRKASGKKNNSTITANGEDPSILLDNKTQFITNIPDPEEVKKNKAKAERANKNKIRIDRQPKITYKVECNECRKNFQSNIGGGEIGQKCEECLRNRRNK